MGTAGWEGSGCSHPLDDADPPPGWSSVGDGAVDPSQGVSTLVTFLLAGLGHRDHRGPHLHGPGLVAERGHRSALPRWDQKSQSKQSF